MSKITEAQEIISITMTPSLVEYIENGIIPRYAAFDRAHREDHARAVIERALAMGKAYDIDEDMLYAAAAMHDLGLAGDRKTHHLESGRIIRGDRRLPEWFTPEQIEIIAEAAEDHRASATAPPRSIYGRLVAEADRMIDPETIIRRTVRFGLSHYPELDKEGHRQRTLEHLHEKYAEGGYLHLMIPGSPNEEPLARLRSIIKDESRLRPIFEKIYMEETKTNIYSALLPRLEAVVDAEADIIANMANVAAVLHEASGWLWTGFYRAIGDELVLGPFQGPVACTRIGKGRGVCGTALESGETVVVPDVEKFPGHIACSSKSRSEIVVPVKDSSGEVIAVLDIDSEHLGAFDDTDKFYLERIASLLK